MRAASTAVRRDRDRQPGAVVVGLVVTLGLALAIVTLDGDSVFTLSYVAGSAVWALLWITAWWMLWGPRR
jgi:hypothetical protein